ncbi:hypothetical protein QBC36DRAFT_2068 [Triangularia setosa]|uniref:Uncharacterized protein n=1 Tax=Triangularia setosa TaxID=2587417 RepID=A0AAN7ACP7_9PEZI|nr:hypothetical protein QBC36DRAFT_2068 [Podospora setosa]
MLLRLLVPSFARVLLWASAAQRAACGSIGSRAALPATQIYKYPDDTFVENLHVLPSGHVLLSTFKSGNLSSINPSVSNPTPQHVVTLDGATGLTGITEIPATAGTLYAVTGGIHTGFGFQYGSLSVYVVLIVPLNGKPCGLVVNKIPFPDTAMMNGLAAIPSNPTIVLSADSLGGRVLRTNILTRQVDVAFSDPALGAGGNPIMPLGVNGIKIKGNYLYFTNSGQGTYARVQIDSFGNKVGPVQVLATLPAPASMTYAYDDFDFDRCGNAHISLHDYDVVRVTPAGAQSLIAGGLAASPLLESPTAVAAARDGNSIFVTTGGNYTATPPTGGQLLKTCCVTCTQSQTVAAKTRHCT